MKPVKTKSISRTEAKKPGCFDFRLAVSDCCPTQLVCRLAGSAKRRLFRGSHLNARKNDAAKDSRRHFASNPILFSSSSFELCLTFTVPETG
ncbi:hypothetical protein [Paenibacillus chibensis]|uniref:hypothetical protein n=1 Tax=Paenibacillus chibensis TaxID=59846 RepID=UPI000FD79D95|nr:hypothetical protein [Paenibacillus chibensis]MEC0372549.1 hypothetical protein [Paenibacillus chibensis]